MELDIIKNKVAKLAKSKNINIQAVWVVYNNLKINPKTGSIIKLK